MMTNAPTTTDMTEIGRALNAAAAVETAAKARVDELSARAAAVREKGHQPSGGLKKALRAARAALDEASATVRELALAEDIAYGPIVVSLGPDPLDEAPSAASAPAVDVVAVLEGIVTGYERTAALANVPPVGTADARAETAPVTAGRCYRIEGRTSGGSSFVGQIVRVEAVDGNRVTGCRFIKSRGAFSSNVYVLAQGGNPTGWTEVLDPTTEIGPVPPAEAPAPAPAAAAPVDPSTRAKRGKLAFADAVAIVRAVQAPDAPRGIRRQLAERYSVHVSTIADIMVGRYLKGAVEAANSAAA